jgi:Arylsulfotransferase (ASST)
MSEPLDLAAELQLDACLAELAGVVPSSDLPARIAARLRARHAVSLQQRRGSRWLAAALVVAGITVVFGVVWLRGRHAPDDAPAVQPVAPQQQEPQGKAPDAQKQGKEEGQDARPDAQAKKELLQDIRDLEIPERRDAGAQRILAVGPAALPLLRQALQDEEQRGRKDMIGALRMLIAHWDATAAKKTFGFPAGEITLISDYSDNRVVALDAQGKDVWHKEDVFGGWDARLTPTGTVLITEFSVSTVVEVDGKGNVVWSYENLKNPYRAERLWNGNTLIADTFAGRVIEVSPDKKIVWTYDNGIRPFDARRLDNGNTLIADEIADRVFEVNPKGETVWQVKQMNNVHAADRLPNGNTLITLRSTGRVVKDSGEVLEVDRTGKTVWKLDNLSSPSDAQRLPDGNTLVAENNQVREFDPQGKVVWKQEMTWAVSVRRY